MGLVLPSIGGEPGGPMWPPLRRDYKPSRTGGSGTRPYGGNEPGALVRQSQALLWNRSSCNCPSGPGGIADSHSIFARRKFNTEPKG